MPPLNQGLKMPASGASSRPRKVTVMVTGLSGYFGRLLLPYLERDKDIARVIGIDSKPLEGSTSHKIEFQELDIRDQSIDQLLNGVDVLVHLAFILMRLPTNREIDEINISATQALCEAAAAAGVNKIIITSSVVAYGLHPDNPDILIEESPLRPNKDLYYGRAKAANEHFLDKFVEQNPGILVTRLRPCTVVGPNADPTNMASMTNTTTIVVKGYNPPIQLLHEADMAAALYLAIKKDLPGTFNVTADEPQTIKQLVNLRGGRTISLPFFVVKSFMGIAWKIGLSNFAPEWADLSRYSLVASSEKLKSAGWSPRFTTREAYLDLLSSQGIDVDKTKLNPSSSVRQETERS